MSASHTHVTILEIPENPQHQCCLPIREVLERIGDKWSLLIVVTLQAEPLRFNELRRRIQGISQRMLTLTLRDLEREGLVLRTVTPSVPTRVDYELTRLGATLLQPVQGVVEWARANHPLMLQARAEFDERAELARALVVSL